jgi:uncharacterized protein YlaN (UPF0358 family)
MVENFTMPAEPIYGSILPAKGFERCREVKQNYRLVPTVHGFEIKLIHHSK